MKTELCEQKIRPRREHGADWDTERLVLAVFGNRELQWWKSGKSWTDRILGYQPFSASLILIDYSRNDHSWKTVIEGGRASKGLFLANKDKIREAIGLDVAHLMHPRKTLIIS